MSSSGISPPRLRSGLISKQNKDQAKMNEPSIQSIVEQVLQKIQGQFSVLIEGMKKEMEEVKIKYEAILNQAANDPTAASRPCNCSASNSLAILQQKLNDLERHTKKKNVIISGIPFHNNENIGVIFQNIQSAVHSNIKETDIMAIHRLKSNRSEGTDSTSSNIIVAFKNTDVKSEFMAKKKSKSKLSTRDLGIDGPMRTIFINDQLTEADGKLFYQARKFKKDNIFKYVWTRNGLIFMRKTDSSKILHIRNEHDLPSDNAQDLNDDVDGQAQYDVPRDVLE